MQENNNTTIEKTITDYIELTEMSRHYGRKQNDLEKEYNKLLTNYNGEVKNYSLEQADKIYRTYHEMQVNDEQSKIAHEQFLEAEEKLKEVGRILFEATITAEISLSPVNIGVSDTRKVTVSFNSGIVIVN